MPVQRPEVAPFSEQNLYKALENRFASAAEIGGHQHAAYLYAYLKQLGAKTLIVEDPYVDADYLDDFAVYYSKCFTPYDRWCKRLHFFTTQFTRDELLKCVDGSSPATDLQASYLGFIVARPLPQTVIGRTVLRTYDGDNGRRHFPAVAEHRANLFGIDLSVKSLPFQEQDQVLAACATVALWSCFQKTADLFGGSTPTPSAITRSASQVFHHGRPIPSQGLSVEEICSAIRHVGLEPELVDLRTARPPLFSLIYGYLEMGVPVALVVLIEGIGFHAITLTGYSVQATAQRTVELPGAPPVPMKGLRIDKFYGHDDQIGPFSRVIIKQSPPGAPYPIQFETSWLNKTTGQPRPVYPSAVVAPVYNKIRLKFLDVMEWVTRLHGLIDGMLPPTVPREWDVHLCFSNDFKAILRSDVGVPRAIIENLLLAHHPRFWWRAKLSFGGRELLELLFDATGIARSFPLQVAIWRDDSFALALKRELDDAAKRPVILDILTTERFLEFLRKSIDCRFEPATLLP
jgi:hypothetical protein